MKFISESAHEIPVHATTDVLVVGSGPAGLAAAIAAKRAGADVLILVPPRGNGGSRGACPRV